jgi:hypothetical protein
LAVVVAPLFAVVVVAPLFAVVVVAPLLAVVVAPLFAVVVVAPLLAVVVVAPLLAVVVPLPWFAVVVPLPLLAVVAPLEWLAVVVPPEWEPPPDGAEECGAEGAAFGADPPPPLLLFFWPQAKLGSMIKLKSKNHFAAMLTLGRVNFIFLSSWCGTCSRMLWFKAFTRWKFETSTPRKLPHSRSAQP